MLGASQWMITEHRQKSSTCYDDLEKTRMFEGP